MDDLQGEKKSKFIVRIQQEILKLTLCCVTNYGRHWHVQQSVVVTCHFLLDVSSRFVSHDLGPEYSICLKKFSKQNLSTYSNELLETLPSVEQGFHREPSIRICCHIQ